MKLLLLTSSFLLPRLLDVFKSEAKALRQKLSIINLEKSFWDNPDIYVKPSESGSIWLLTDSKTVNITQIKALLALSKFAGLYLIFLESGLRILSLISKFDPQVEDQILSNQVAGNVNKDLNVLAESSEQSVIQYSGKLNSAFDNIHCLNFEQGSIRSVVFEEYFKQNPHALSELTNNWFADLRFDYLYSTINQLSESRIYRISPALKIVSSSRWLDGLFSKHWAMICARFYDQGNLGYKTHHQMLHPILSSTIKAELSNVLPHLRLDFLFDRLMSFEQQIDEYITGNYITDQLLVDQYSALSGLEQLNLFESNFAKINHHQKLSLLSAKEKKIKQHQLLAIEELKSVLLLAKNYDEVDLTAENPKNLMIIDYDRDLILQIHQAKLDIKKQLWFDVSRITNADSLTEINITKYKNFAKDATVLTTKHCAGKLGRLLLSLEFDIDAALKVKPDNNKNYDDLVLRQASLSQAIFNFWQPLLYQLSQSCLLKEAELFAPKLNEKIKLDREDYFSNAAKGSILIIALDETFEHSKPVKHLTALLKNQPHCYLIKDQNGTRQWEDITAMIKKHQYTLVMCQLNLKIQKQAYEILNTTNTANIVFWQDEIPPDDVLAQYDQQNWEFVYYLDSEYKINILSALIK